MEQCELTEEGVAALVDHYTREAGVRNLERQIGAIIRSTAVKLADGGDDVSEVVSPEHVESALGPHKYRAEGAERQLRPGVATGLAYSPDGGRLMFIEASKMPGKGNVVLTGNMRNVMQESASAAVSYVRSRSRELHLDPEWIKNVDLHLHVPHHGVPKDGPSAGVAMFAAVASLLLDCAVRADVAMTGEISLRGRVLRVEGLTPKLLAAHRAGIREVVIPERNRVDLEDTPDHLRDELTIRLVSSVEDVLPLVLEDPAERANPGYHSTPSGAEPSGTATPP
jgi:ATP-dependent Lon protease